MTHAFCIFLGDQIQKWHGINVRQGAEAEKFQPGRIGILMQAVLQCCNGICGVVHKQLQALMQFPHAAGGATRLTPLTKLQQFAFYLIHKLHLSGRRFQL